MQGLDLTDVYSGFMFAQVLCCSTAALISDHVWPHMLFTLQLLSVLTKRYESRSRRGKAIAQ